MLQQDDGSLAAHGELSAQQAEKAAHLRALVPIAAEEIGCGFHADELRADVEHRALQLMEGGSGPDDPVAIRKAENRVVGRAAVCEEFAGDVAIADTVVI